MNFFRTIFNNFKNNISCGKNFARSKGFTLLEAVITVSIMGILVAVVTPSYLEAQNEAKLVMSEANISQISQAFVNLYFEGLIEGRTDVWPDEPIGNEMSHSWASSTTLFDGRTVAQMFSSSRFPYNPYENPFLYYRLAETENEPAGFRIDDPDTGVSKSFRP